MSAFHHSREFSASPEQVFQAIQNQSILARWWGPIGFSNTFDVFEFAAGGRWIFTMHGPDGKDYANECAFVEIVPNALLRLKHVNLPRFELTLTITACAKGAHLDWLGVFENKEFAEGLRDFLTTANEQNLDRLEQALAGS
jgi:hypothetical protein